MGIKLDEKRREHPTLIGGTGTFPAADASRDVVELGLSRDRGVYQTSKAYLDRGINDQMVDD